jgi:hypothetical protein
MFQKITFINLTFLLNARSFLLKDNKGEDEGRPPMQAKASLLRFWKI